MTEERFLLEKREMDELLNEAKRKAMEDVDCIFEKFEKEFLPEFFKESDND
jgi:hypothetical protein